MRINYQCWSGGQGDVLLASTLAEGWVREYGAEVYIKDGFRNSGIKMLWETNPFIMGFTDESTTHIMQDDKKLTRLCVEKKNSVKGIEAYFDLPPINKYPKIYFKLEYKKDFRNKVLVDPSAITAPFTKEQIDDYVNRLCNYGLIKKEDILVVNTPGSSFEHLGMLDGLPRIQIETPIEYASLIWSSLNYVCVSSGSSLLASAVKGHNEYPNVHCLSHVAIHNKRIWDFENLSYYYTGKSYKDFDEF